MKTNKLYLEYQNYVDYSDRIGPMIMLSFDEWVKTREVKKPTHKHQFTIPVVWQSFSLNAYRTVKTVTKLRCACGEETDR